MAVEKHYSCATSVGQFTLQPFDLVNDTPVIHNWVTKEYARYWQMQNKSLKEVRESYSQILHAPGSWVFIGVHNNTPAFLLEVYVALNDPISKYYDALEGDYGFHILVAPVENPIHGFTRSVFQCVIHFLFSHKHIHRLIVEPDIHNEKIHVLNKSAGFRYENIVELPTKTAHLAFCTREYYAKAISQ
jgi:RimJ/RimL family protein N-acetyltransferase